MRAIYIVALLSLCTTLHIITYVCFYVDVDCKMPLCGGSHSLLSWICSCLPNRVRLRLMLYIATTNKTRCACLL